MTTIKKGTILKKKDEDVYRKVFLVIDDVVFLSTHWFSKMAVQHANGGEEFNLLSFITENYDIVEEEWKPENLKPGDGYWFIDSVGDVWKGKFENESYDKFRLKSKNIFPTKEKAEEYRDKILNS